MLQPSAVSTLTALTDNNLKPHENCDEANNEEVDEAVLGCQVEERDGRGNITVWHRNQFFFNFFFKWLFKLNGTKTGRKKNNKSTCALS